MAEKITKAEIKKTVAVAIGGAFGFIIALLWKDVIIGLMKLGGLWADGGYEDTTAAAIGIITVLIITIVCVVGILYISKWGGADKE